MRFIDVNKSEKLKLQLNLKNLIAGSFNRDQNLFKRSSGTPVELLNLFSEDDLNFRWTSSQSFYF
jgi:hypothetical protein